MPPRVALLPLLPGAAGSPACLGTLRGDSPYPALSPRPCMLHETVFVAVSHALLDSHAFFCAAARQSQSAR
eukprot:8207540-Pyramimonas_sp.AAC.1